MRSWDEVTAYVRAHYYYEEPGEGYILLARVDGEGARSMAILARVPHPLGGLWTEMTAPIGNVGEVDINDAVRRIGMHLCGGISIGADMVLVRHTFPIESTSEADFERFLASVTDAAKALAADASR